MRERVVLDYLRDNPRFFRRHQSELTRLLRLAERDIVDLTGKQLIALRDENTLMRKQLHAWYANAADNEGIVLFLHRLAVALLVRPPKPGRTAKVLSRVMRATLHVDLCKLCDLAGQSQLLTERDRKRLEESLGVLRTAAALPSLTSMTARGDWGAFLYVPVYQRRKLRAVIVCAMHNAREIPRDAHIDYAVGMAELVGVALTADG